MKNAYTRSSRHIAEGKMRAACFYSTIDAAASFQGYYVSTQQKKLAWPALPLSCVGLRQFSLAVALSLAGWLARSSSMQPYAFARILLSSRATNEFDRNRKTDATVRLMKQNCILHYRHRPRCFNQELGIQARISLHFIYMQSRIGQPAATKQVIGGRN
jgi:hypothetical protein